MENSDLRKQALGDLPKAANKADRLTHIEFESRYFHSPQIRKAELIEGFVYVASPVRLKNHGYTHAIVMSWLRAYSLVNPGVDLGENATVRICI